MKGLVIIPLVLRALSRRIALLLLFAAVLLLAAGVARWLTDTGGGHAELDTLFAFGGPTLASAFLLTGWLVGRLPLIVTLVLMAGLISHDRAEGTARLFMVRPVSPLLLHGTRFFVLAALSFALCAIVLPLFDLILLGRWAGAGTLALIAANVIVYGGLVALLSVWTRADAWIALLLSFVAMTWHALRSADLLAALSPAGREVITFLLPPHGALFALESAFGQLQPVPWDALGFAAAWGIVALAIAAVTLSTREV
ncbi:MAG: hypothetical protein L0271_28220 [Gemmatimonadetes bacterium]|nr:hypothetical protein [Gemmatimonadota bacterium]